MNKAEIFFNNLKKHELNSTDWLGGGHRLIYLREQDVTYSKIILGAQQTKISYIYAFSHFFHILKECLDRYSNSSKLITLKTHN
jgi:hypothetical protein